MAAKLTDKQRAFCREYMIDLNATKAAVRAGYSKKGAEVTASKLLRVAKVQSVIEKLRHESEQRTQIKADDILRSIKSIADDASQLVRRDDGTKSMLNPMAALRAYELLGKHLAMWTERREVNADVKLSGIEVVIVDPKK